MTPRVILPALSDAELIQRFLRGDEAAFRTLYARHTPRLRAIVWRMLGPDRSETEDVIQDTWLAGCRSLHRFNGNAKFGSWLTTIGIRAAYRVCFRRPNESPLSEPRGAQHDGPATTIDLERSLAKLPAHQRCVVVLHDIEGFRHEEIAEHLGIAIGTSKGTLSRAREALRGMLNDGVSHVR